MSKLFDRAPGKLSGASQPASQAIEDWLIQTLAELLALDPLDLDVKEPLKSYGLASVDAVGLTGDLEDWLGREISPTLVYDYPTIEQIARYLAGEQNDPGIELAEVTLQPVNLAEPVAIIGIACRFPGGASSPEAFWELLQRGADARIEIPAERWQVDEFYHPDPDMPDKMYTRYGCLLPQIEQFDADFFGLSPGEVVRMDPQQRLLLEVAWEALENAGVAASSLEKSRTGVFLGMMQNHEYAQLQMQAGDGSYLNDPYFGIGSAPSIASGRLSYLLDLHGPALAIDTACSSSLVAAHLACQSLRHQESQMALVGGVNMILLPENMVNACKMKMLAPDGRCKTFDASADGFVMGEGCGFVVLKLLSDALANNDPILAVIRGSAVNQDGRSNGMTAPNRLAQEAVIRQALQHAGIAPERISYVEAHGSGTPLGDPIEIEALHNVLGQQREAKQDLLVGSVKTNIGHLAGAAGIAGLIKTVLALQHREIPAHLHLSTPNPHISWQKQSIAIPTTTVPWPATDETRMAGVSSFGWSGTNAHLIMEEAPARSEAAGPEMSEQPDTSWQLFPISARTQSALNSAITNLHTCIQAQPDLALANIASTLQLGRNAFERRRLVRARTRGELLAGLQEIPAQEQPRLNLRNQQLAFLLPGTGEQYPGMARELYQQETTFRTIIDECCAYLKQNANLDLFPFLSEAPSASEPAQSGNGQLDLRTLRSAKGLYAKPQNNPRQKQINRTKIAQPLIFVVEYALARLLMEWGLHPQAMLGYSLGEYVAACLAGVLSLEDALTLVAHRAQLIERQAKGAMLAVMLSENAAREFVSDEVSLAILNAPQTCVLAGPPEALARTAQALSQRDIAFQPVETTHAFHSSMLTPIQTELIALVQKITLNPPAIPYISNISGTWITPEQATDPTYWAQHMCQTVRFADGVGQLLQETDYLMLEVGPGKALGSFVRQHPFCKREQMQRIFGTLPSAREDRQGQSSQAALLSTLGNCWLAGCTIDWHGLHHHQRRQPVLLPTYPFERQRYWPELHPGHNQGKKASAGKAQAGSGEKQPATEWFYQPIWKQVPLTGSPTLLEQEVWLVLVDDCGIATPLLELLRQQGQQVISVVPGSRFEQLNEGSYTLRPTERADYLSLFQTLRSGGQTVRQILHLWTLTPADPVTHIQQDGFFSLLALAQALGDQETQSCAITIITNGLLDMAGNEHIQPEKATLLGPCRIIPQEYAQLSCRLIDINLAELRSEGASNGGIAPLLTALVTRPGGEVTALRGKRLWEQNYEAIPLVQQEIGSLLREEGVYLITGGLGGIGLALAEHLAHTRKARLVLVGRTALPARQHWDEMIRQDETGENTRQIRTIQALERQGSEILICPADVSDEQAMRAVVQQTLERFGTLHGCFHAAGVPGNGLMQFKTPARVAEVFQPKIQGTLTLERVLQGHDLDFLVLFSSTTAITGSPGQVDYCAANAFLDAYASQQSQSAYPVFSINWSEWQWNAWGESAADFGALGDFLRENRRRYGLTFAEGMEALERILSCHQTRLVIAAQPLAELIDLSKSLSGPALWKSQEQTQQSQTKHPRPELASSYVAPGNALERQIAGIWEEVLGFEQIGIYDNFFDLGGNSLVGINLISRLRTTLKISELPAHMLFEAPSISALANYLAPRHAPTSNSKTNERSAKRREMLKQRIQEPRKTR